MSVAWKSQRVRRAYDAAERQRQRLESKWRRRQRRYGERYPLDEDFLAALSQMRTHAALLSASIAGDAGDGTARIDQVLWTPST